MQSCSFSTTRGWYGLSTAHILHWYPRLKLPLLLLIFHPISFIGIPYGIVAKILLNHLSNQPSKLILLNQMTFLRGRNINDNFGYTHEFLTSFNAHATSHYACITIDFRKAFDMSRWDAINESLEWLGFNQIFRDLTQGCLKFVSFFALVEGSSTKIIQAERGVRQGDFLSPLFFVVEINWNKSKVVFST